MTIHHLEATRYYNTIGSHDPVLTIVPGDSVEVSTVDARGVDKFGHALAVAPNPMVGPIYIQGAEPGDTLAVHFDHIRINRATGWTANVLAANVVDPAFVAELPPREILIWDLNHEEGTAKLAKPLAALGDFKLALHPFLGCFGVAAARSESISTATSAEHGGNMDYRGFLEGTIAYFPVFEPGALFFLGDGHALQGDGEIVGTGIETSLDVKVTFHLHKGKKIGWPRGEDKEYIFTIGNARPLDQATQHATTEMLKWLREDYGLDYTAGSILLGQCVEYDLGNVFDPAYTMVCKVKKSILAGLPV